MKKFFTLIAACMAALSMNAQDWNASKTGVLAKGTTLLDNEYVTVVTGVQDSESAAIKDEADNPDPKTYAGFTFNRYVNIRVDAAPAADNDWEGTAYTSSDPVGISLIVTAKQNTDMTLYYKHGDGKVVSCYDQTAKEEVAIAEVAVEDIASYYTGTFKFISGHKYTIYARGGTTGLNGITTAAGTYVEPQNKVYAYSANTNEVTYADGAKMQISSNTSKNYGKGGANIVVDGATYSSIKNSNGAQNTFTAATGKKIYRMNFYAVPNNDGDEPKFQEFNGTTLAEMITTVKDGANATKVTMCINGAETVTFTFGGKQVNFVVDVDYSPAAYDAQFDPAAGSTDGIANAKAETANGAIYNLAGQPVGDDYKGVVIKDGKKFTK